MVLLLDLPSELLQRILEVFVQTVPLNQTFLARPVCQTFASVINHEVLAKTPSETFDHYLRDPSFTKRKALRSFLSKNLGSLILNHARCPRGVPPDDSLDIQPNVPKFINTIVEEFMQFAPSDGDALALREQYRWDLVALTVSEYERPWEHNLLVFMAIEDPLCEDGNYYDMIDQVKLSPTQALSAAAAIGNLRAVEHFVEKGGEILSTTAHNGVYDRPMSAAATTGQLVVLGFCIEYFERAVCRLPPNISDLEKVLDRSIKDAIKAANWEALALLLDCYQRNARFFPAAVHDKIGRYSVFWTWFTDASRFGCVNTFTTLITKMESMDKRLGHEELRSAYSSACMHGHTELVQYLLQNNMVHVNAFGNPLRTAIEYSHRGVALVLLKNGADIHDHKLLRMALCGDKSTKYLLVKFLLDNGYLVTQNDLQALRKSIFFDPYKHLSVDENMALVLLSQEIKKRMDLSRADVAYQMVDQLRGIKDGLWPVPTEPMPFRQIAHEVFEWVHSLPGSPQVEQRAERGGTSRRRSSKTTPKSIWD